ncbi:MAG: Uma2 family endonuclease [Acidobacteria bacterium]|nr:Uma2 family endonuclease [Acidobacteriota bacterium]
MSAAAAIITLDDYLRMSFEGPDAEYVDGEIVERPANDLPHVRVQQNLAEAFGPLRKSRGVKAGPSVQVRVSDQTIRVPDYCVFRSRPAQAVPAEPALLVVEIVSPSDSHSALIRKLEDYRAWGAEHIWVIDPDLRRLSIYRLEGLIHVERLELAELEIVLGPADLFE